MILIIAEVAAMVMLRMMMMIPFRKKTGQWGLLRLPGARGLRVYRKNAADFRLSQHWRVAG